MFCTIKQAYEVLSNPKERSKYNQLWEQKWAHRTSGLSNSWSKKNDLRTRGKTNSPKPDTRAFGERRRRWKARRGPPPSHASQDTGRGRGFTPYSGGKDESMAQHNAGYTRRARSMEGCVASEVPPIPHNRDSQHTPHTSEGSKRASPQPSGPGRAPGTEQQASPERNRRPLWNSAFSLRHELRLRELGQFRGPVNSPTQGSNISTAVPQLSTNVFVDHTMSNQVDVEKIQRRRILRPHTRMKGQQPCVKND